MKGGKKQVKSRVEWSAAHQQGVSATDKKRVFGSLWLPTPPVWQQNNNTDEFTVFILPISASALLSFPLFRFLPLWYSSETLFLSVFSSLHCQCFLLISPFMAFPSYLLLSPNYFCFVPPSFLSPALFFLFTTQTLFSQEAWLIPALWIQLIDLHQPDCHWQRKSARRLSLCFNFCFILI